MCDRVVDRREASGSGERACSAVRVFRLEAMGATYEEF